MICCAEWELLNWIVVANGVLMLSVVGNFIMMVMLVTRTGCFAGETKEG